MSTSKKLAEHKQLSLEDLDGVAGGDGITRGQVATGNFQIQTIGHSINPGFRTYENQTIKFISETLLKLGGLPGRMP